MALLYHNTYEHFYRLRKERLIWMSVSYAVHRY